MFFEGGREMKESARETSSRKAFLIVLLMICAGIVVMAVLSLRSHSFRLPAEKPVDKPIDKPVPKPVEKPTAFTAQPTPARLARGRYLVETVAGCFDCHTVHHFVNGQWVAVNGRKGAGQVFPAGFVPLPPGARVVAPNITPDRQTGIGSWTDAEIERAIRHGVAKGGRPLFDLMPYWQFRVLSNEDVKSIIVYLRSLPPVHNALPVTRMPFPMKVSMNDDLVPPLPKDASPLVRHGWELVRVAGCEDCHTPILAGGRRPPSLMFTGGLRFQGPFGTVFSPNITFGPSGIGFMSEAMFSRTLRTGRLNGTGYRLKPPMPFAAFRHLKQSDIKAIYAYLRTFRPVSKETGKTDVSTPRQTAGERPVLGHRN